MRISGRNLLSLTAFLAANVCQADFVTIPFFGEAGDMGTNTSLPLNIGSNFTMRYQQVYNATDFRIRAPDGGYLTEIWFRPDAELGRLANTTLQSIQVNLSTTSRAADSLSPLFADNIGLDETVVFGPGPLRVLTGGTPSFDVSIRLTQPFLYDPHAGNLLLDIRNSGGGVTTYLDATGVVGDSVSRVYALGVGSASGTADTLGLVTGFSITPVPEPAGPLLFAAGLLAFSGYAWRRKDRARRALRTSNSRHPVSMKGQWSALR
jgi:hypothetical protein